jgi:hypothetical protein
MDNSIAQHHRAEQVWDNTQCAARSNNLWFPARIFNTDILAARRVAIATGHRGNGPGCQVLAQTALRRHAFVPAQFKARSDLGDAASYFLKQVAGVLHSSNIFLEEVLHVCGNLCKFVRFPSVIVRAALVRAHSDIGECNSTGVHDYEYAR